MSTKDQIFDAARAELLSHGPQNFSMRRLARAVGISPMTIYRHFADKEDLLAGLMEAGYAELTRQLQRGLFPETPRDRMKACIAGYLDFAQEHPGSYQLMFNHPSSKEETERRARRRNAVTFRMLQDRVRDLMTDRAGGEAISATDMEALSLDIWAMLHGLITLQNMGKLGLSDEEFRQHVYTVINRLFPIHS